MTEAILWGSLAILAYIYVGYPVLAIVLGRIFPRLVDLGHDLPSVTIVVTAYNERQHIEAKLRNLRSLRYARERLEIIVASDASDDGTDEVVLAQSAPSIRLLRVDGRAGKTGCQNAAAAAATGDILVFTDATTEIDAFALPAIVRNFNDESVGCVAGRLTYVSRRSDSTGAGGTSYWGYEIALRLAESAIGSLIGVSGCLYAVRRSAYRAIPPELISDFVIAMVMREQGLRTVLEPEAVCFEYTLDRADRELSMRIRVGLRSLAALAAQRRFLNPLRYGAFAWQLWSHKLLRYLSPVFLSAAFLANLGLAAQGRYVSLFVLQCAAIAIGLLGFLPANLLGTSRLAAQPYYFLLTNLASAISLVKFIKGDRVVTWTPQR